MEQKIWSKNFVKAALFVAALILVVVYFSQVTHTVSTLWRIVFPLVLGSVIAYILQIPIGFLEVHFFPHTKKKWVREIRKPACLVLCLLLIVLLMVVVANLVLPQVIATLTALAKLIPGYVDQIGQWALVHQEKWPVVEKWLNESELDWESMSGSIMSYATQGINGLVSSSVGLITSLTSGIFNLVVALAFAIYLLISKERLSSQIKLLQQAYIKKQTAKRIKTVLTVANESFSSFIVGQCTEALVLGTLCTLGMLIFKFPYALSVGVFTGVTSLIPVFGAYLGAAVGILLILPVDPAKALLFIVFIIILQQLEGNIIYPKIVGTSIGLPGIWVFVAVIMGGGLLGIVGMLLGVPIAATMYKLLRMATMRRLESR